MWYIQASKLRPSGASRAKPSRTRRSIKLKRLRDYRFVEALPKNNYGKVLKTERRRLLADAEPG